mmetsp:Transcript_25816/g.39553  ORF Transcript_25816/g.39553 Transcript_25816/m.39553 type:complete len:112 (-) Transcript_25816:891-1226(-)|eukprot:CAMPEP_0118707140 /NCGR_PEP_ID=MMETSP0800-20121206/21008_1 /TAXON_ID=210618 ORGANISM="Striatella unipunctata, Strain CCMP2910" /NCGR_SAMPLE_ID=MMETSP0800 /ASSEMBLY_ACC=CAM_ASM_000638 /LENGTH=111 /DNA_ID=CAMNT_0006609873 /DNA_START=73 /DNA_END=408 /DNA_ORIENTATION=-
MPELKSFLKDGEAEEYRGVSVEYVMGRKAVMTIYNHDGTKLEDITLSDFKKKSQMHKLMQEKGFVKMDEEEARKLKARNKLGKKKKKNLRRFADMDEATMEALRMKQAGEW